MDTHPPICLAFVNPLGVDSSFMVQEIKSQAQSLGYEFSVVKIKQLFKKYPINLQDIPPHLQEIEHGNRLCAQNYKPDLMARLAVQEIKNFWRPHTITLIQSLKRPKEVDFLRSFFGQNFFLLGLTQSKKQRQKKLEGRYTHGTLENRQAWAQESMYRDEFGSSEDLCGQNVRKTFPEADVFFNLDHPQNAKEMVERFFKALFSHPFVFPSVDEVAMSHAFTEKLRSGDTSRPVGAALTDSCGHLICCAYNEVPKAGGGVYRGSEPQDGRDWPLKLNTNYEAKRDLFHQVVHFLQQELDLDLSKALEDTVLQSLKAKTNFMDILEYSRNVHAEMNLLMQCARRGVVTQGTKLYSTTFPCHSCAKHIIAAGIQDVIYIDPFAKSRAEDLFKDSITLDSCHPGSKLGFRAYTGFSPRRYDLYSPPNRENNQGQQIPWAPHFKSRRLDDDAQKYPWEKAFIELV